MLSLQVEKAEGVLINGYDGEEDTVKIYADTLNMENIPEGSDKYAVLLCFCVFSLNFYFEKFCG